MKKTTKPKYDKSNGKRNDWKNEAENEIILMQEEMDELADELGLNEETTLRLEKIVDKFKGRLTEAIELFEVTPEIAVQDDEFLESLLDEIYYDRIAAGTYELDRMAEIVTEQTKSVFVHIDSIAQEMRLDAFLSEMSENPYQLKLIA